MTRKDIITEHPMKWYKFTVYFHLFAFAVIYVVQGMTHLQGVIGGFGTAKSLYLKYPALKQVEIIIAVLGFIIAILAVVCRQLLWYFHPKAPKLYMLVMALAGSYHFIYDAFASLVIGIPIFTVYDIGAMISMVPIVLVCRRYFFNRSDLFSEG